MIRQLAVVCFVSAVFLLSGCNSKNSDNKAAPASPQASTSADSRPAPNPLRNAYFGDLHLHTSRHSLDSIMPPEAMVQHTREIGLDGVVVTEHDWIWTIPTVPSRNPSGTP